MDSPFSTNIPCASMHTRPAGAHAWCTPPPPPFPPLPIHFGNVLPLALWHQTSLRSGPITLVCAICGDLTGLSGPLIGPTSLTHSPISLSMRNSRTRPFSSKPRTRGSTRWCSTCAKRASFGRRLSPPSKCPGRSSPTGESVCAKIPPPSLAPTPFSIQRRKRRKAKEKDSAFALFLPLCIFLLDGKRNRER